MTVASIVVVGALAVFAAYEAFAFDLFNGNRRGPSARA